MALASGTKLGPYEIQSPLGAGGMGEVYRARDTRLGRDVAIKVLPSHLSSNPDLKTRFEREARGFLRCRIRTSATSTTSARRMELTIWSWSF
jgi:serine/threonine protein kinase